MIFLIAIIVFDVKIKILNEIELDIIKYLCIFKKNILNICKSPKFWRYRIAYLFGSDVLPKENLSVEHLRNFYNRLHVCKYYNTYTQMPCQNKICRLTDSFKYCKDHIGFSCKYCKNHCKLTCKDHLELTCKYYDICTQKSCQNEIYRSANIISLRYCKEHLNLKCQYTLQRGSHRGIPHSRSIEFNPMIKGSDIFCNQCMKKKLSKFLLSNLYI